MADPNITEFSYGIDGRERPGKSLDDLIIEARDEVVNNFRKKLNNNNITTNNIFIDYRASRRRDPANGQFYQIVEVSGTMNTKTLEPVTPTIAITSQNEPDTIVGSNPTPLTPADRTRIFAQADEVYQGGMTTIESRLEFLVREENVLHNFKSYTYLFTLAGIEQSEIRIKKTYEQAAEKYVIARSAGKKETGIQAGAKSIEGAAALLDSFNKQSPGRFNFYFDDTSIESLIGFNGRSGLSKATNLTFTIIEPYSMNGFIEALQATAIATGYTDLRAATYLLSLEFMGYPDDLLEGSKQSQAIHLGKLGSRYFPIKITEIEVTASASGTRYTCRALAANDLAFGNLNIMPTSVNIASNPTSSASANTVGSLCEELMRQINLAKRREFTESNNNTNADTTNPTDSYFVYFPESANDLNDNKKNKFYNSPIVELNAEDTNYQFANPAEVVNGRLKYDPSKMAIPFSNGTNIHDCVASIVRDCQLIQTNLYKNKPEVDSNGMLDYFYVHIDVEYGDKYNEKLNRYPMIVKYFVIPFKIHANRLPDVKLEKSAPPQNFKMNYIKRTYNWIYTGQNRDIINFNLKLNTLFYHKMPLRSGTGDPQPGGYNSKIAPSVFDADALGNRRTHHPEQKLASLLSPLFRYDIFPDVEFFNNPQYAGVTNRPVGTNPYLNMARNFYNYLQNTVDLVELELEIIGDPFFVIQGGVGGARPQPLSTGELGITQTGEANHMVGEIYVIINFKVPNDIDPTTGLMNPSATNDNTFSGVYRIVDVVSKFSGGSFTQQLKLLRVSGFVTDQTGTALPPPTTSMLWKPQLGFNDDTAFA
jgi:hypothetical protein